MATGGKKLSQVACVTRLLTGREAACVVAWHDPPMHAGHAKAYQECHPPLVLGPAETPSAEVVRLW